MLVSAHKRIVQSKRRTCVYTYIYTQSASGADRSGDSSGPAGVWRASTRSEQPAGCCGPGLGCGSQTLLQILSVSLCCLPWLGAAGQQSRFLCVFLHWRRQRLPTYISTVAPEGSWLSFHYCEPPFIYLFIYFSSVCVRRLRTACYQRRQIKTGYFLYKAAAFNCPYIYLFFYTVCCWLDCYFLHWWNRVNSGALIDRVNSTFYVN